MQVRLKTFMQVRLETFMQVQNILCILTVYASSDIMSNSNPPDYKATAYFDMSILKK